MNKRRTKLDRRSLLQAICAAAVVGCDAPDEPPGPIAVAGAQSPPPAPIKKVTKASTQYQDQPKDGQRCNLCRHFVAPSSCKLVEGQIDPQGWCTLWVGKAG